MSGLDPYFVHEMKRFDRIPAAWRRLIKLYGMEAEELYAISIPQTTIDKGLSADEAEAILIKHMGKAI